MKQRGRESRHDGSWLRTAGGALAGRLGGGREKDATAFPIVGQNAARVRTRTPHTNNGVSTVNLRISFSTLAMTAAIAVLAAGCATKQSGTATQAAAPAPAPQAAPAPAAPPAPPVPEGMSYDELTGVLGNGNEKRV